MNHSTDTSCHLFLINHIRLITIDFGRIHPIIWGPNHQISKLYLEFHMTILINWDFLSWEYAWQYGRSLVAWAISECALIWIPINTNDVMSSMSSEISDRRVHQTRNRYAIHYLWLVWLVVVIAITETFHHWTVLWMATNRQKVNKKISFCLLSIFFLKKNSATSLTL